MFLQPQNKAGEKNGMNDIGMVKLWPEIEIKKKFPVDHVQFVKVVKYGWDCSYWRKAERREAEAWKTSLSHCNPGKTMMV